MSHSHLLNAHVLSFLPDEPNDMIVFGFSFLILKEVSCLHFRK